MPDNEDLVLESDLDEDADEPVKPTHLSDNEIEKFYTNETFRVIHQNNNFFIPQIKQLIDGREIINIRPEYQRRLRWSNTQKSLLIESLLLNIPVPPIFLYESDLARYEVMDGQQRLNAIREFMNNEFRLTGLSQLHPLNGKTYSKIPPVIKKGLDRSSLAAIVLLFETDQPVHDQKKVRRYVFERLNTGGRKLNHQEVRNAVYGGPFNDLIVSLTRDETFTSVWEIPEYTSTDETEYYENPQRQRNTLYRTMGDCQIVVRFFAFLEPKYIRGSVRSILDSCMMRHLRDSSAEIERSEERYLGCLKLAYEIFDGEPFRILARTSKKYRLSVGLYDAVMVALDRQSGRKGALLRKREKIQIAVTRALSEASTYELIVGRANTSNAIQEKIAKMEEIISDA
jgi:hypothetical protein